MIGGMNQDSLHFPLGMGQISFFFLLIVSELRRLSLAFKSGSANYLLQFLEYNLKQEMLSSSFHAGPIFIHSQDRMGVPTSPWK